MQRWQHRKEFQGVGTFYFRWGEQLGLCEIEIDEGFTLEDLLQELGRLERKALGHVKHGDVPPAAEG